MRKTILLILLLSTYTLFAEGMAKARESYYKATEEEEFVEKAISLFEKLSEQNDSLKYVCEVYIGSLIALKATYTMWPQKKLEYANDGIEKMEKALESEYNNIESLFIYGTTTHYLPFFFNKSDESEKALFTIIELINEKNINGNKELLKNALEFIIEETEPNQIQLEKAKRVLQNLS